MRAGRRAVRPPPPTEPRVGQSKAPRKVGPMMESMGGKCQLSRLFTTAGGVTSQIHVVSFELISTTFKILLDIKDINPQKFYF